MAKVGPSSTRTPRESILKDGVFCVEDASIGDKVEEIEKKGFPFKTLDGLEFCKLYTFDDKVNSRGKVPRRYD
jgi:hypothetical protein